MPASFKDDKGREWVLRLDHTLCRQIRSTLGIDLHSLEEQGSALQRMADDPALLVDTVYLIVEPQCQRQGISDEEFGRGFTADVFDHARMALLEALLSFTTPHRRGLAEAALKLPVGAMQQAEAKARELIDQTIQEASNQLAACGS